MISALTIVLFAAHNIAGAAIRREAPTTACTTGQASNTVIVYLPNRLHATNEATISTFTPVMPSYAAIVPRYSPIPSSSSTYIASMTNAFPSLLEEITSNNIPASNSVSSEPYGANVSVSIPLPSDVPISSFISASCILLRHHLA